MILPTSLNNANASSSDAEFCSPWTTSNMNLMIIRLEEIRQYSIKTSNNVEEIKLNP